MAPITIPGSDPAECNMGQNRLSMRDFFIGRVLGKQLPSKPTRAAKPKAFWKIDTVKKGGKYLPGTYGAILSITGEPATSLQNRLPFLSPSFGGGPCLWSCTCFIPLKNPPVGKSGGKILTAHPNPHAPLKVYDSMSSLGYGCQIV
ncbi:MAG: hypothetical protein CM15mP105_0420 [Methanobacteriota archaeon]|nr:MAG: hypothetical protein CM15mP105_0420 [Euryarchaeota archaeon]